MKHIIIHVICLGIAAVMMTSCKEQNSNQSIEDHKNNGNLIGGKAEPEPEVAIAYPESLLQNLFMVASSTDGKIPMSPVGLRISIGCETHDLYSFDGRFHELEKRIYESIYESIGAAPEYIWVRTIYAGIKSMKLTADVTLFGRKAGSDLSDKFKIMDFGENIVLVSYPDGNIIKGYYEDKSQMLAEWACSGAMLSDFKMKYDEIPHEKYDTVTYTLEIETTDSKVLKGECTVEFDNE